jgi:cytochrome c peroxidase
LRLALLVLAGAAALLSPAASRIARPGEPLLPLPPTVSADLREVALGERLFADRRLSGTLRLSCTSCHDLATNGATANATDRGDGGRRATLNTPTVFNAALNFRLNWEGNARNLRDLSLGTLRDDHLLGGGRLVIDRLRRDPAIDRQFRAIFGRPADAGALADTLAAYLRTLTTPGARFDRWLEGDRTALTPQEIRGYDRFRAVGCTACHQGANIGGNLYQRHGIFHPLAAPLPVILRVPSLRNVAVTAPYFHDGSAATLPEAVRQMARAQLDMELADGDVRDIVAFLGSLTGRYRGRLLVAPHPVVRTRS